MHDRIVFIILEQCHSTYHSLSFAAVCVALLLVLARALALAALLVLTAVRWTTAATYRVEKREMISFCGVLDEVMFNNPKC